MVHTEIIIPATPEEVWSILSDPQGYKEWNPVLVPIEGELIEGEKVKYHMTQLGEEPSEVTAKIIKMEANRELNQYGGIWGILAFDHQWLLEPSGEGTKVIQHEEYRGIGVLFWDYSWVEPTYTKANEALKERVLSVMGK